MGTALKALLESKHMQSHLDFRREYDRHAKTIDASLVGGAPARTQYYRWLNGDIDNLPRAHHCRVLEQMFPGWTADKLFEVTDDLGLAAPIQDTAMLKAPDAWLETAESPGTGLTARTLSGYWVTSYKFSGNCHHADISYLTAHGDRHISAQNRNPQPRSEGRNPGFGNNIRAELAGRHLTGRWKNATDNYYFGLVHLAILPGETVMQGYYTSFTTDVQIVAEQWKWARLDAQTVQGVDLSRVQLRDPHVVYAQLAEHSHSDAPLALSAVTEGE